MKIEGEAVSFGDNVNTGTIISVKYLSSAAGPEELVPHLFEAVRPGIAPRLRGAVVVGGVNFGAGSSREHAVTTLKAAGVGAVLARSFARSYFRNAINLGLPVVELDTRGLEDGHRIEVDLERGEVRDLDTGEVRSILPLPEIMSAMLREGGLIPYFKKHGSL